jgi:hypothetical protein
MRGKPWSVGAKFKILINSFPFVMLQVARTSSVNKCLLLRNSLLTWEQMEINTWCSKHTNKQKTNTINQKSFCGRFSVLNFLPRGEKTSVIKHHTFIMNTDLIIARTQLYKGMCVCTDVYIRTYCYVAYMCVYVHMCLQAWREWPTVRNKMWSIS